MHLPNLENWIQIFIWKPIQFSLFFPVIFGSGSPSQFFTWVRTLKLGFSPIFTQNENSWFSMWEPGWEPTWEPGHPVRTAQHCCIYLCGAGLWLVNNRRSQVFERKSEWTNRWFQFQKNIKWEFKECQVPGIWKNQGWKNCWFQLLKNPQRTDWSTEWTSKEPAVFWVVIWL